MFIITIFTIIIAVGLLASFYVSLFEIIHASYQEYKSIDTGNYIDYVKILFSAINGTVVNITEIPLYKCPPLCSFKVESSLNESKKVILSVDNPYAVPILLMVYYYPNTSRISRIFLRDNLINKLIIIDYTTLVDITFDNELHLVAFPLVPLSDVTPRNAYVKQSLNLTLNVKALTIVGFLSPLIAVVSILAGIISALGIAKYIIRTPVADIMRFSKLKLARIILLVPVFFAVILPFYTPFSLTNLTLLVIFR